MIRYCSRCILPDTRPGLEIDSDGVCSACRAHPQQKDVVDWNDRAEAFESLVAEVKSLDRPYDCVVTVSGGKDSHWQTIKCLEAGLHPLAVTWKPPARTQLGRRNLENLISLGVDHIDFSIDPRVERRFLLRSLERFGTTAIPMHLAIFNVPTTIAARFEIPLVMWGEDPAREYSGHERPDARLTDSWIERYGAVHGTTAADWVSSDLSRKDLTPFFGPDQNEIERIDMRRIFLGWYFRWDPSETARVAAEHGFASSDEARTGYYEYADIDDDFISIHHWIKWHKFGFTRTFDNLSLEIRNGRIAREDAIEVLRERGDETPHADIERFCSYVGISRERFDEIVETFRDPTVWSKGDGAWVIDGFLVPDWDWTVHEQRVA